MNVFTTCLQADWAERIGWTLLHSLWQIALVAAAYTVVSLLLRNRSADFRYVTGCAALLGMLGLPIGTCVLLSHDSTPASTEVSNTRALAELSGETMVPPNNVAQNDAVTVDPLNPIAPPNPTASEIVSAPDPADPVTTDLSSTLRPWLPWATVAWLMGVLLLLLRPLWGWLHMRRLQRHGLLPLSDTLRHVGERSMHRLGVKRAVRFAQSALVEVPAVVGYLRPMVLLPASAITGLSAAEIEMILAHELAHVRRHDSLVNLAQTVIEALLFYHPGMWWISNQIRKERENCCDDVAVAVSRNRVRYLQALARLEEQRSAAPSTVLAATGGSLLVRVRRLLGQPTNEFGYCNAAAGLAGLVTIGFVAAALAMNQAPREASESSPEETVQASDLGEEAANHTVRPVEAHQSTVSRHELRYKAFEAERAGDMAKAMAAYKRLVEKFPEGRALYAAFLGKQGKIDEAIEQYRVYYAEYPQGSHVLANLSDLYAAKGRFAEAIKSREAYIVGAPPSANPENRGKLLELWRKSGNIERAAQHYLAIAEDKKAAFQKIVLARLMLADMASRGHDTVEARKQYWLALEEVFPVKDKWAGQVPRIVLKEFLARGWLDDAVRAYRRHPVPPWLSRLGDQLKRAGRGQEMLALYREHLLMRPAEHGDYANEGAIYGPMGFARQLIDEIVSVGQGPSVVEALRARVAEDPKSIGLHKNLGYLLYKMKRYEPALSEFDEVVRLSDRPSATFYEWSGRLCAEAKLVDEAINYYEKAQKTEFTPEDFSRMRSESAIRMSDEQTRAWFKARVLAALGELYKQKKQWADAERCFLAVVDLKPHVRMQQRAEAALAEIWKILDKENVFLKELEDRVAKTPDDAGLRREYAKALHTAGDLRAAVKQYTQSLELSPDDLEVRLELARALSKAGDHDQAVEQYEKVLVGGIRNPPRPTRGGSQIAPEGVLRELAKLCNDTGRQEKLLGVYQTILEPKTPEEKWSPSEYTLTTILRDMTKILASRADYQAIIDLWVTHHEQMQFHARSAIGENAPRLDSLEPLIERLQQISRKNRNDFWARFILGDVLIVDNKRQEAMAVYAGLSKDAADDRRIHHDLAYVYQRMQRYDLAIAEYEQVLRHFEPGDQEYLHTLNQIARLNLVKGDKARAAELYRELIRHEPGDVEHYRGLHKATDGKEGIIEKPPAAAEEPQEAAAKRAKADQLAAEGKLTDAIAMYKEILARRSTDVGTMVALARAYQSAGRPAQAVAMLEKAHAMRKWTGIDYGARSELVRIYSEAKADDKLVALYAEQRDYSGLRDFYRRRKQPEKFQEYLREQLEKVSHDDQVRIYLGLSYLDGNNLVAAREVYEGLHGDLVSGSGRTPDKYLALTVSQGFERLGETRKALQIMESIDYKNDPDANDWSGDLLMRLYAKDDRFAKALEICALRLQKDADGRRTITIAQEIAGFAADCTDGARLLDAFLQDLRGKIPGRNYNRFLGTVRAYRLAHPAARDDGAKTPTPTEDILSLLKEGRIVRTPRSARNLADFLDQLATQAHTTSTQSYRDRARQLPVPNIERTEGPAFELLAESINGKPVSLEISQEGHWALFEHGDLQKKSICAADGGIICTISNAAIYRRQSGSLDTLGRMMFEPTVGRHVVAMQSQVRILEVVDDQNRNVSAPQVKKPRWGRLGQLSFSFGKQDRAVEKLTKVRVETAVAVCTRWATLRAPRLDHTEPISLKNDGISVTIDPLKVVKRGGQDTWQLPISIRRSLGADAEKISTVRNEMHFVTADGKRQKCYGSGTHAPNRAKIGARVAVDAFDPATTSLVLREPAAIEIVPIVLTFHDVPILDR